MEGQRRIFAFTHKFTIENPAMQEKQENKLSCELKNNG